MYDSAGSLEEFMLNVDQLLPQCPKILIRAFLLGKRLEKRPAAFIGAVACGFALYWGGLLTLFGVFLSTGHDVLALAVLIGLVASVLVLKSKASGGKCWRIGGGKDSGK